MLKFFHRPPDVIVGDDTRPYMLRWHLLPRNRWCNAYLHKFVSNDDDRALHDHPWVSLSILIRGQYIEVTGAGRRLFCVGSIIFRSATYAHRIELVDGAPCWTLFLTGRKVRSWGFLCRRGWIRWQEFCRTDNPGKIGRGCGE